MLETSDFVHGSAMWSLSYVMSECSLSGRGQGHVSNFYRWYTQLDRRGFVYDSWDNGSRLGRVTVECTLFMTHCLRLNLQLHTIDLVRTYRICSFCTVAWQLARFQLTRRIAQSLGDSWASCFELLHTLSRPLMSINIPRSLLICTFLRSVISDSRSLSMSSQQLAADPLSDDDIEL